MALTINRSGSAPVGLVADRRLYTTADRSLVLEDGDPAAAYLLAVEGTVIPQAEVERLGLALEDGHIVQRVAAPEPPAPVEAPAPAAEKPRGKRAGR